MAINSPEREKLLNKFIAEELEGLLPKQVEFITEYLKDYNAQRAVQACGYSKKNAHATGHRLVHTPKIKALIEKFKAELAKESIYDLTKALEQNEEMMQFARAKGQMMAVSKFLEFKLRMTGHMQDKLSIDHNLKGNFILQLPNLPPPEYALPEKDVTPQPTIELNPGTKKTE